MTNEFRLVLASSVGQRDGIALELVREGGERVAEVFEDEATKRRTFAAFTLDSVPLEAIDWLIETARTRL